MNMMTTPPANLLELVLLVAIMRGYTAEDLAAAVEHHSRTGRRTHPPGEFDEQGRFYAEERTTATDGCRRPSARWPYSEMKAARTAVHCAEVGGSDTLSVRRLAAVLSRAETLDLSTAHARLVAMDILLAMLKRKTPPADD